MVDPNESCFQYAGGVAMITEQVKTFTVNKDRAWIEINMANLRHNVNVFKKVLPSSCKIMAVVKANGYGHGSIPISLSLNSIGIDTFAVATIDEGIELREAGIKGEILILGYTSVIRASELVHYRLSQTVVDAKHAEELDEFGKSIQVHIKVDTGMSRLGENYRNVSEIAAIFNYKNLKVTGIFTHLSVCNSMEAGDVAFTNRQIHRFYKLVERLQDRHVQVPKIHIQSSYGVLNYPELRCDYVRLGIALYGVLSTPDKKVKCSLDLRPVLALKSKVIHIKTISQGESVSYGRSYVAQKEKQIAIVSIGYADGIPRSLSMGNGHVLVGGCRVPIIGQICMDQLIVDVTGLYDVHIGSTVILIGKDGTEEIAAEQMAADAKTITNELLSRLSVRLKRIELL